MTAKASKGQTKRGRQRRALSVSGDDVQGSACCNLRSLESRSLKATPPGCAQHIGLPSTRQSRMVYSTIGRHRLLRASPRPRESIAVVLRHLESLTHAASLVVAASITKMIAGVLAWHVDAVIARNAPGDQADLAHPLQSRWHPRQRYWRYPGALGKCLGVVPASPYNVYMYDCHVNGTNNFGGTGLVLLEESCLQTAASTGCTIAMFWTTATMTTTSTCTVDTMGAKPENGGFRTPA